MRTLKPTDLQLNAIDLKTLASHEPTDIIEVEDFFQFRLSLKFTGAPLDSEGYNLG